MPDVALLAPLRSWNPPFWASPRRGAGEYRVELIDLLDADRDPGIRATWERLFNECDHPNAFHASPAWSEYTAARGARVRVVVVRDHAGAVLGVVPISCHSFALDYEIGSHAAVRSRFGVANVSGGLPLMPEDESLMREMVDCLFDALPECDAIHFDSLPVESAWWDLGGQSTGGFVGYHHSGNQDGHLIDVDGTFEDYARGLSPKLRSNAQRAVRTLQEAHGTLELACCRSPDDVDRLFSDAQHVRRRSWQNAVIGDLNDDDSQTSRESLSELARRGLLRSYVLRAGEGPCAFVIGYQYRGVYFYAVIGFDPAFSRHSPGIALLYLLLQDLFTVDRPRLVSFGRGDDLYKRRFGTRRRRVGGCLLFRPTLRNGARMQSHRLFTATMSALQKALSVLGRSVR